MGSHIGNFDDGDLVFVSPNIPHVWRNDQVFYEGNKDLLVDVYVIHFTYNALGKDFFELPEFANVRKLFSEGQQGLLIRRQGQKKISKLVKQVYNTKGIERIRYFLKTLETLAEIKEFEPLSSPGYVLTSTTSDQNRINKVIDYLMMHYQKDIVLDEVANLVNLNKSSFCRYFKSRTSKTYSEFLNEIRVAHACKLLAENNMSVSEICYETGYNNISHFNRKFKQITGLTASDYAKKYLDAAIAIGESDRDSI